MSKIGEKPINIEREIQVRIEDRRVYVKGKEGELMIPIPHTLDVVEEDAVIKVKTTSHDKKTRAMHGLIRSLLSNAIAGVMKPWEKRLQLVGTGYRVKSQGSDLVFEIGFSHPVIFRKRENITFVIEGNNKIIVRGVDKQKVGETAMKIKQIKKPDIYKGKGIRYERERLKLKPGKKAKITSGVK